MARNRQELFLRVRVPNLQCLVSTPSHDAISEESSTACCNSLPIRGDEAALEQLFLNILLNAAHAIAPGGEGTVELQVATTLVQVTIRDNGAGIPAERLESVFDPFYTTKIDGTGLGLSVARQIVAAHGGSISIDSSVGRGTSVVIGLPVAK